MPIQNAGPTQNTGGLFRDFPSARQAGAFQRVSDIQTRTRQAGFDSGYGWGQFDSVYRHLKREVREFGESVTRHETPARQLDELGDVLFIASALGEMQNLNPERALHKASDKFVRRYKAVEQLIHEKWGNKPFSALPAAEKRRLWTEAKYRLAAKASR